MSEILFNHRDPAQSRGRARVADIRRGGSLHFGIHAAREVPKCGSTGCDRHSHAKPKALLRRIARLDTRQRRLGAPQGQCRLAVSRILDAYERESQSRGSLTMARRRPRSEDFALHGGGFPLRVPGVGVVAAIAISGLPSREDHDMIVTTLAAHLNVTDLARTP